MRRKRAQGMALPYKATLLPFVANAAWSRGRRLPLRRRRRRARRRDNTMAPSEPPGAFNQTRPGMRRKSSAQNMLASLKPSGAGSPAIVPSGPPTSSITIPGGILNSGMPGFPPATTPTPTAMMNRDWDAQSLASESIASSNAPLNQNGNAPSASVDSLRDVVTKRMITLTYMRNVHEG